MPFSNADQWEENFGYAPNILPLFCPDFLFLIDFPSDNFRARKRSNIPDTSSMDVDYKSLELIDESSSKIPDSSLNNMEVVAPLEIIAPHSNINTSNSKGKFQIEFY